jgi:hypothetical protein
MLEAPALPTFQRWLAPAFPWNLPHFSTIDPDGFHPAFAIPPNLKLTALLIDFE